VAVIIENVLLCEYRRKDVRAAAAIHGRSVFVVAERQLPKLRRQIMPKIPIDECPAGPAMDAAVAKALGWVKVECDGIYYWSDPSVDEWHTDRIASIYSTVGHKLEGAIVWSPSTDIAAAWELLPRMQSAYGILLALLHDVTECKIMKDDKPIIGRAEDEKTEPSSLAISRAFLKARGIEFIEMPE
jgi:hypothetical protein